MPTGPFQNPNQFQQQPPRRSLEDTMHVFVQRQMNINEQNSQMLGEIKNQLVKLTTTVGILQQEKGKFPTQPQVNPQVNT